MTHALTFAYKMRHHGRQMPTQLLLLVLQWNGKERKIIQAIRQATYNPLLQSL